MIQDIKPSRLDNSFKHIKADPENPVLFFTDKGILLKTDGEKTSFPQKKDFGELDTEYVFSIDDTAYFLAMEEPDNTPEGCLFRTLAELRDRDSYEKKSVFAAFTAFHLWKWYSTSRFCGACGAPVVRDTKERALVCPECGNRIYPRINPAVIIGVINGESILITRYRTGYSHNALIAGFCEIGETVEETVEREVMEEAGIRVKNIRYYGSQPWGPASDVLMGFYCEVDGDDTITMDKGELRYAEWVPRKEIVLQPGEYSLTNEMMKMFRDGLENKHK